MTAPAKVKQLKYTKANSWLEITIHEGRKRQVRRMMERVGHSVIKLKRIRINGISLGRLESGAFRYMTPEEIKKLKKEVGSK
jgi:23S rRNA pseudouridine2605 synthase